MQTTTVVTSVEKGAIPAAKFEVPEGYSGVVVEMLGQRKGQLTNMHQGTNGSSGTVSYTYLVPTRGLLGFRQAFLTSTRGTGVVHSIFYDYAPFAGPMRGRGTGSITAWEPGLSTAYALFNAQERGRLFISPGVEVYEGMIVGQAAREGDMPINVAKKKHLTNHRSAAIPCAYAAGHHHAGPGGQRVATA